MMKMKISKNNDYIDRIISENINDFINKNILSEAEVHNPLQFDKNNHELDPNNFDSNSQEHSETVNQPNISQDLSSNVQQITNDNSSNGEGTTPQTVQPETTTQSDTTQPSNTTQTPNVKLWKIISIYQYEGYIENNQTVEVYFKENQGFFNKETNEQVNIVNFSEGGGQQILIWAYKNIGINSQYQRVQFAYDANNRVFYNVQNPNERYSEVLFYNNNEEGKMENETPSGNEETVQDDDNVQQSGLAQGEEGNTQGQRNRNGLKRFINQDEDYPISNALERLIKARYIDPERGYQMIRELEQTGW